ncbi:armadillo-type protein [Catenaria anguillulae PL171]|uniref:Armadillo-type protein n=1 Tax=Catenaria anguillulae PL171 TaxID=765915 RepID=A0A1Y2HBZ1_9FUNG|nr:armadillo-type protein [Catenaria anguillulae PL171]
MDGEVQEIDWSMVPLPDRLGHKNWKGRQSGYDDLTKQFRTSPEDSPVYAKFASDIKKFVLDANMVAQEAGVCAAAAFMEFAPTPVAARVVPDIAKALVDKCIASTRAGVRAKALDTLLFSVEVCESADPILDSIIGGYGAKAPKSVAAAVNVTTALIAAFGPQLVNAKIVAKQLAKLFGHSDKNVRAEAQALTLVLYQYYGEAVKNFLGDLKPVQQKDLETEFAKLGGARMQPSRMTRNQKFEQASAMGGPAGGDGAGAAAEGEADDDDGGMDDLIEPVDVLKQLPGSFFTELASTKWKERKEALDNLLQLVSAPKIKEDKFGELVNALAKRVNDANIVVANVAIQCLGALAKGLRKDFAPYRHISVPPLIEKCKEKKANVIESIRLALDAIFASTSLDLNLEDTLSNFTHKNPQVKAECVRFLTRCLKSTRAAPGKAELKAMAEAVVKAMDDSTTDVRDAAAEALGTLMKLIGERPLLAYLEKLDAIKQAKVREFAEKAEIKGIKKAATAPPKPAPAAAAGMVPPKRGPPARLAARLGKPAATAQDFGSDSMEVDDAPPAMAPPTRKPAAAGARKPAARPQSMMARPGSPSAGASSASGFKKPAPPGKARPQSMMQSSSSSGSLGSAGSGGGFGSIPAIPTPPSESEYSALPGDPRAKVKRAGEDRGPGRWILDGTRPDLIEFLREQATMCFALPLVNLLFSTGHYKEKDHIAGLNHLAALLTSKNEDCLHHSDVILKYVTVRFQDTNTTIALKCLDIVEQLVGLLEDHGHSLTDYEANAFFPSLLVKLGDNKEPVRTRARALLVTMNALYPPHKLFPMILKATESKNSRQRAECIDELGGMISRVGMACCPPKAVPTIAGFIAEREATVRNAALGALVEVARAVGESQMYKLVGRLPEKEKTLLQQKIKRAAIGEPPTPGRDVMEVDIGPVRDTPARQAVKAAVANSKDAMAARLGPPPAQPKFGIAAPSAAGNRGSISMPGSGMGGDAGMYGAGNGIGMGGMYQQPVPPAVSGDEGQYGYGGMQADPYGQQQQPQQQFGRPQSMFGAPPQMQFQQQQQQQQQYPQSPPLPTHRTQQQQPLSFASAAPQRRESIQQPMYGGAMAEDSGYGGNGMMSQQPLASRMQPPSFQPTQQARGFQGPPQPQFHQQQQQHQVQQQQFGMYDQQQQHQQYGVDPYAQQQQQQHQQPPFDPYASQPAPSQPTNSRMAPPSVPNFSLSPEKVGVSTYSSKYESVQQRETIMDLLVTQIMSNDAYQALEALRQVEKIIPSNPQLLINHGNQLLSAVALQIRFAFMAPDSQVVMRLCKHLLHTLLQFFDVTELAASLSIDTLSSVMSELLRRLLDHDLSTRTAGVQLVKALNMLMVRILDKSPANVTFGVLLKMLGEAMHAILTSPAEVVAVGAAGQEASKPEIVRFAELTMKCLWKVIRQLPVLLKEERVNVAELIRDIHVFLDTIQAADWKKRETPLGDVPIRTIKTMLSELTSHFGERVLEHFYLVEDAEDAYVYTYTRNLLASQQKKQRGGSSGLGSGSVTGSVHSSADDLQQSQHAGASIPRPGSGMSQRSYASSSAFPAGGDAAISAVAASAGYDASHDQANTEALQQLQAIFSKIATKEQSKDGLHDLYHFQKRYPHMQAKIDEYMSRTGPFFQSYIKRNLANFEQQQQQHSQHPMPSSTVAGGYGESSYGSSGSTSTTSRSAFGSSAASGAGAGAASSSTNNTVSQLRARLAQMRANIQTSNSGSGSFGSSGSLNSQ